MAAYFRHFTSYDHFYGEIVHELSTNLLLTGTGEQFNEQKVLLLGKTQLPNRHTGKKTLVLGAVSSLL